VYTNDQLVQIYKDCIVKAQQGKINQDNAWTLHLVDNIKEITDLNTGSNIEHDGDQHDDDTNAHNHNSNSNQQNKENVNTMNRVTTNNAFARASHTIDAASKIYGYRVDSVHSKTYKVLGSIHQQNGNEDGEDGDALHAADEDGEKKKKRQQRNRNVGRSTLCELDKLSKINETMKNLCVEVDALFHKTASCFDEGGAKGLLMNTLYVQNGCDIVFDSQTKIEQNEDLINHGVQIDIQPLIDNELEIQKENQWIDQLFTNTFKKEADSAFDGFTQIDTTSPDFDVNTQTKPHNFVVDMDWVQSTSICPLLNVFEDNILSVSSSKDSHGEWTQNHGENEESQITQQSQVTPEKDLNNHEVPNGAEMFADEDDEDVLMDMPDFTIGGDDDLNAQDLFHEELLTQQVHHAQPALHAMPNNMHNHNIAVQQLSNLNLADDGNHLNIQYVLGQNAADIGNMGVHPLLNNSHLENDNEAVLNNLRLEQANENGQYNTLHERGIYRRGAMNLSAMNAVISKLENADFESLTTFFDTKKHGNWAGPDQWYHRRYQLTLQQSNKSPTRTRNASRNASRSPTNTDANTESNATKPKRARKEKKSTRFDFMSIARGNLIDEKEFEEPQRSYNTLTKAVLDKNRKTYHTLPEDLQMKPDMFIKLFHRPNYSVWRHWLRQHQIRMMKVQQEQEANNANGNVLLDANNMNGSAFMAGADDFDDYQPAAHDAEMVMPLHMEQRNAVEAVLSGGLNGDDMEDDNNEFQYNYNNPLDTSHFVPDMNDGQNEKENYFDFQLNGYDLVDADPQKRVDKIKVEFATTAKKVNVRKLKLKLWDKINTDLEMTHKKQDDVEMNVDDEREKMEKSVTFQETLDTLPSSISSAISVHMCFICLLHLANEKELQLVPRISESEQQLERGDFGIQCANENSVFEKEAEKINPIVVLGM